MSTLGYVDHQITTIDRYAPLVKALWQGIDRVLPDQPPSIDGCIAASGLARPGAAR
jgi:hypothetical protein